MYHKLSSPTKGRRSLKTSLLVLLTIYTLCLIGTLSGCSQSSQSPSVKLVEEETEEASSADPNEVDAEYYLGETVFVGDSRTNGLLTYQLLPPEQIFAIDGSTQKVSAIRNLSS